MRDRRYEVLADPEELAQRAAGVVTATLRRALGERATASMVLAGGRTPRRLYRHLAEPAAGKALDWSRIDFFWSDERCVPPEHPDSNRRMAEESLLRHLALDRSRVHAVDTSLPPDEAARRYEEDLVASLGPAPAFDVVLLGLGADGHTASIFPGTRPAAGLVTAAHGPTQPRRRVSLSARAFDHAGLVLFLVAGTGKAAAVARVLAGAASDLPAAAVRPRGRLLWLLDRDAAGGLEEGGA